MTMTTPTPAPSKPRTSTLDRPTLMRLAATEYARASSLLSTLADADWSRPTECPGWDVRAMAAHMLGMAEMAASIRDGRRQQKAAQARGGDFLDALTALQVDERASMSASDIALRYAVVGPRAARARKRTPWFIRRRRMPIPQNVGGALEDWTLGYLIDTILTRDPWVHRIDISRAVQRRYEPTTDHDGVLVADIVTEWAARHGKPYELTLTGPAGGYWRFGTGGEALELDAIEFVRTVSGRETGAGLLAVAVPF